MKRPKKLSTSSAYANLFNRAAYIRRGHKLTRREEKRARDALEILARTPTKKYEAFIHEVAEEENAASQLAVLFAIEIGCQISKVLSQQTCRELPVLLKENAATLKSNALQSIVKEIEADSQKISDQDAGIQDPMPGRSLLIIFSTVLTSISFSHGVRLRIRDRRDSVAWRGRWKNPLNCSLRWNHASFSHHSYHSKNSRGIYVEGDQGHVIQRPIYPKRRCCSESTRTVNSQSSSHSIMTIFSSSSVPTLVTPFPVVFSHMMRVAFCFPTLTTIASVLAGGLMCC
jgi:hypothetical protein